MRTLSQKARYALRALELLAREDGRGPVRIAGLARDEELPKKFLEVILLELKNHGILNSKRGKGGGYSLRKSSGEITLGQVVRLFDGPLAPLPCASEAHFQPCAECRDPSTCATREVMKEVRDAIAQVLDKTTVRDLVMREDELRRSAARAPMYHI